MPQWSPPETRPTARVERVEVAAFTVPTDAPEADGTLDWDKTTIVVVHARAAGQVGLGYTYADAAAAVLVERLLAGIVAGREAMDVEASYVAMVRAVRNLGRQECTGRTAEVKRGQVLRCSILHDLTPGEGGSGLALQHFARPGPGVPRPRVPSGTRP